MIRRSEYEGRREAIRAATNADQAEIEAFIKGSAVIERGLYDDRIAEAMDDYDPDIDGLESWHATDLRDDAAAGSLLQEIERRLELLGESYPFEMQGNSLIYVERFNKVYEFCLAICCSPSLTRGEFVQLPRQFEQVSRLLFEQYLGPGAESHHTGWPQQAGLPTNFKAIMAPLYSRTGEWRWDPEPELPEEPKPQHAKDEGIDFVAWKAYPDGRIGHLFFLGQCACGQDWQTKYGDVNPERLAKWFRPMTYIMPARIFCTPFNIPTAELREASRTAGIILDRVRLALISQALPTQAIDEKLRTSMTELISIATAEAA